MMKSFFKKLAFVMALAMVVSMAAPAGSVFADEVAVSGIAIQNTKDVRTEFEMKVEDTVDFCFLGAPKDWKTTYKWESSDESVATVDKAGIVTAVAPGTATITITAGADKSYVETVKITVKGEFEAKQVSDSKVELTFSSSDVTKASLEAALGFYYYIGEYKVEVNLIKSISEVKKGVATVELYDGVYFTDGTVYGFTYGDETAEFTAKIGEVANILFTYDKAYVEETTKLTPVLYNADGIDITKTALKVSNSEVRFTLEKEAENGEYWLYGDDGIYFEKVAVAMIKVQYFGGYDDNYEEKVGPSIVLPVVSEEKPAYGIDFTASPTYTITDGSANWNSINKNIAVGDVGYTLFVKTKDNTGAEVISGDNSKGTWSFASSNVSKLYVTDDGLLMPNAAGNAVVLVYYTPENASVKTLVAAINVTVSPKRAISNVTLDQASATISTEAGYNEAKFIVTMKDGLGTPKGTADDVTVKVTTSVKGATQPSYKVENDGDGKVKITVTGIDSNIPSNKTSQAYTFTVKANGITKTFSVTVKSAKKDDNGNLVANGYQLTTDGVTDVKVTDKNHLELKIKLNLLSNGVVAGTQNISGKYNKNDINNTTVGGFYYEVKKDGNDITNTTKVDGATISVDLTTVEEIDNKKEVSNYVGESVVSATSSGLQVVKKTQGAGKYTVNIYQSTATKANPASPAAFKPIIVNTFSVTVGDTQDTASYGGQVTSVGSTDMSVAENVMNCFKFKIGNKTYEKAADYKDAYIAVNANTVNNGKVVFVNSVDIYKETKSGAYIEYTITVNDYITLQ